MSRIFIWSGRPGSNRRPSRWQRDVLPTELLPRGAEGRIRTADTMIFHFPLKFL